MRINTKKTKILKTTTSVRRLEREYCSKAFSGGRKGKNGGTDTVCNSCKRNSLIARLMQNIIMDQKKIKIQIFLVHIFIIFVINIISFFEHL